MDGSGDEDAGDTVSKTVSSGAFDPDTIAKNEQVRLEDETGEISRITGSSVVRTVVTFLAGLGVFFALLYALSMVLNSY